MEEKRKVVMAIVFFFGLGWACIFFLRRRAIITSTALY